MDFCYEILGKAFVWSSVSHFLELKFYSTISIFFSQMKIMLNDGISLDFLIETQIMS